jgi:hypothetical protein
LRSGSRFLDFGYNPVETRDVLLEDEIEAGAGGAFKRNRLMGFITFTLINMGYCAMGMTAFLILRVS